MNRFRPPRFPAGRSRSALFAFLLLIGLLWGDAGWFGSDSWAASYTGDVSHDCQVSLVDAILALQAISGKTPVSPVYVDADVDGDHHIGLAEAIHALRVAALQIPASLNCDPVGELTMIHNGDRIIVSSSKAPTWKVEFAVGSGAPGGGTAVALHVPADDSRSIVEPRPHRACCSAVGLDNLEWRWRPWGGTQGTRGSAGLTSNVNEVEIIENDPQWVVFQVRGQWLGISSFERTVQITPDGFRTFVSATYAGTTGEDSMWWVMSLFRPDKMDGDHVMVSDDDTGPVHLPYTPGAYRSLPSGISLPYTFHFPLTAAGVGPIKARVVHLGESRGNPNGYEFFDQGTHAGDYYLFYPRWVGSFKNVTYFFELIWRFTPEE